MKLFRKIGSVLMIVAILLAFSPAADGGQAYAASIKLSKKTVYMSKGKTYTLKVKGTKAKVKWKSSNKKIVTVSKKGKLKAKGYGTAKITAKVKGKTLKCTVKVERKAEKNARKLRDYILKKGKKAGSKRYIEKKVKEDLSGETFTSTARITANSKNKELEFTYSDSYTEPPEANSFSMTIDLISGSASLKAGTAEFKWYDGYSIDAHEDYFADINTRFKETYSTGENQAYGIVINRFESHDEETVYTKTDAAELNNVEFWRFPVCNISKALTACNKIMTGNKTLKKDKINLKTIGFSEWEPYNS